MSDGEPVDLNQHRLEKLTSEINELIPKTFHPGLAGLVKSIAKLRAMDRSELGEEIRQLVELLDLRFEALSDEDYPWWLRELLLRTVRRDLPDLITADSQMIDLLPLPQPPFPKGAVQCNTCRGYSDYCDECDFKGWLPVGHENGQICCSPECTNPIPPGRFSYYCETCEWNM